MFQTDRERAASRMIHLADWAFPAAHARPDGWGGQPYRSSWLSLSDEDRELLSHLKSDDLVKVRWPSWR